MKMYYKALKELYLIATNHTSGYFKKSPL